MAPHSARRVSGVEVVGVVPVTHLAWTRYVLPSVGLRLPVLRGTDHALSAEVPVR